MKEQKAPISPMKEEDEMAGFDVETQRVNREVPFVHSHSQKKEKTKPGEFLRGPVPWEWLVRASSISPSAVHVGLVVWHLTRMRKSPIQITKTRGERYGLSRWTLVRRLRTLEAAGLVSLEFRSNQTVRVTLIKDLDPSTNTIQ